MRDNSSGGRKNASTRLSFLDRVVCLLSASLALRRAIRLAKLSRTGRAFTLFARAARAGLAEGQYRVGRCYLEGSGVPASLAESMRWLERAATQDHAEAQWLLAAVCIHGAKSDRGRQTGLFAQTHLFSTRRELQPDYAAAEKWARRAAECGSANLAFDGDEGLTLGRAANYVVVIVDRMLPRIDGIEVVRRLRRDSIVTPTLIVSALSEIDDRVRGLRAGGDDFLVKPFALVELLVRVDALARRSGAVAR